MQANVPSLLALPAGSQVLEAGCGFAQVALSVARHGMRVTAIDFLDYHVNESRLNIESSGLPRGQVIVKKLDYHHLESIPRESHDGVYTVQALGHAQHLETVLEGFHRILKPGGRIALIEAERRRKHAGEIQGDALSKNLKLVNEYVGYPTNELSGEDYFKEHLKKAGFVDVEVRDYSENVLPMLRLCYIMLIVPFFFVKLFGLEKHFVTMFAINYGYVGRERWRLIAVSGTKPSEKKGTASL
jgi:sterol 24-C-methyltransferase